MLSITTLIYLFGLFSGCLSSIALNPLYGIMLYLIIYVAAPPYKWWGASLYQINLRNSLIVVIAIALGVVLKRSKLQFKTLLCTQEKLLLLFLSILWLSHLIGSGSNPLELNALKITKVFFVLLLSSHVVTDMKRYKLLIWTIVVLGMYLGYEAYSAPAGYFFYNRLNAGGGTDFNSSNFIAGFLVTTLPFIGVMFLKGGWKAKIVCIVAVGFVLNGIILCRSRGAFLALLVGGGMALLFAYKGRYRARIALGLLSAAIVFVLLTDPSFWRRTETIHTNTSLMDKSSYGRIQIWKAAVSMFKDHPLGVGEGKFKVWIGRYNPDFAGRDSHNAYLRCLTELGIQGLIVFLLLFLNAFRILGKVGKWAYALPDKTNEKDDFLWHVLAGKVVIVMIMVCSVTGTYTYIEWPYWLLMFPVFLNRARENKMMEGSVNSVSSKTVSGGTIRGVG